MRLTTRPENGLHQLERNDPAPSPIVSVIHAGSYFSRKAPVERLIAALLLVPASLCVFLCVVLVRLTSRGPGIYRQTRVGMNGQPFVMYKIRTMRIDAEAASGAVWTQVNDPRVTAVGRIIRRLHLDEFPQLLNVLKGEMSLVGPRPERPEFTSRLALQVPGYLDRLAVRPGITGLSQINLPPDVDLDSVRDKLHLDLKYVRQGSFALDVRILMCTLMRLLGLNGLFTARVLGIRELPPRLLEALRAEKVEQESPQGANGTRSASFTSCNGNGSRVAGASEDGDCEHIARGIHVSNGSRADCPQTGVEHILVAPIEGQRTR